MMKKSSPDRGLSIDLLLERFQIVYGRVVLNDPYDPVSELVLTILSQNTTDKNSGAAFAALRKRFGDDWDAVRRARPATIANAIRQGGLADQKAPRIKAILQEIHSTQGTLSLDHLDEMSDEEALDYLTAFPGVGPKTAACVLMFSLRRPVLPVDTHVHRVGLRLGLIPPKTDANKAHSLLQEQLTSEQVIDFHIQMIRHGKRTCIARQPRCSTCVLQDHCPAAAADYGLGPERTARALELLAQARTRGTDPHPPPGTNHA